MEDHNEAWEDGDPLWDLLEQASPPPEPDVFFARNVVRSARLLGDIKPTFRQRISQLFVNRTWAVGAAACVCAVMALQVWPETSTDPVTASAPTEAPLDPFDEVSSELSDMVIEEILIAAADDPSIISRDEVVSLLGL